jgi:HEAT repeat protein
MAGPGVAAMASDEIDPWIALLATQDYPVAIDRLLIAGPPALRRIMEVIEETAYDQRSPRSDGRFFCKLADALGRLGAMYPDAFLAALRDGEWSNRFKFYWILANLDDGGDPRVVAFLIDALKAKDVREQWAAARGLLRRRDARACEPLAQVLRDHSKEVRIAAVEALYEFGDRRAVGPLRRYLARWRDDPKWVRELAAEALARLEARGEAGRGDLS